MSITKRYEFDAAHRLIRHGGKCANIHGHRYLLEVTVDLELGQELDDVGRVIDFSELKLIIEQTLGHWDHAYLTEAADPLASVVEEMGCAVVVLSAAPTIETMVREAFGLLHPMLKARGIRLTRVRGFETPNSWADYWFNDWLFEEERR